MTAAGQTVGEFRRRVTPVTARVLNDGPISDGIAIRARGRDPSR
jgi:hypothetical protein